MDPKAYLDHHAQVNRNASNLRARNYKHPRHVEDHPKGRLYHHASEFRWPPMWPQQDACRSQSQPFYETKEVTKPDGAREQISHAIPVDVRVGDSHSKFKFTLYRWDKKEEEEGGSQGGESQGGGSQGGESQGGESQGGGTQGGESQGGGTQGGGNQPETPIDIESHV